ncbi:MAG: hypothetical protein VB054_00755 [Petrimonas sp.]|nr:hypothetical protein [Petrimonas sp.]
MELLFLSLQKQLADNMPEIALIDEDYGQLTLNSEEDTYPVTFPCILIGIRGAQDWKNLAGKSQKGDVTVDIKLAIDCYDDTHHIPGMDANTKALFNSKAVKRMQLAKKVHLLLQNFAGKILLDESGETLDKYFMPLKRSSNVFYNMPHGIKVYEQSYTVTVMDILI